MSLPLSPHRFSPADLPDPVRATNVLYDPSLEELREFARPDEQQTEFGSPAYRSRERSRNAEQTRNAIDEDFDPEDYAHVESAVAAAHERRMICLDRRMGRHPDLSFVCRYFVPVKFARIARSWGAMLESVDEPREPDFQTVQVPDHDDLAIRVLPDEGITAVLGTDYTGEAKKSFLRLFMYEAKRRGGIGLHAGSKAVTIDRDGELRDVGQLFLGLSATGKSTLTCHDYGLEPPETARMYQDDVCALLPDGTVAGSEGRGLYVKTKDLSPTEQPDVYAATTAADAVLENVDAAGDGTVDFHSDRYSANGRATIGRNDLPIAAAEIDLRGADQLFFITRNDVMPPIAKLSAAEGAAAFMLGESIQTSAGDPDRAGEAVRVVGTNPFIIGAEAAEGNLIYELIDALDIACFLLNTGSVGDRDIGVGETVTILREVARGRIAWTEEGELGMTVPASVPGMDIGEWSVVDQVDDFEGRLADVRADRREYLHGFAELADEITDVSY